MIDCGILGMDKPIIIAVIVKHTKKIAVNTSRIPDDIHRSDTIGRDTNCCIITLDNNRDLTC